MHLTEAKPTPIYSYICLICHKHVTTHERRNSVQGYIDCGCELR